MVSDRFAYFILYEPPMTEDLSSKVEDMSLQLAAYENLFNRVAAIEARFTARRTVGAVPGSAGQSGGRVRLARERWSNCPHLRDR